jgi:hypothetical protein
MVVVPLMIAVPVPISISAYYNGCFYDRCPHYNWFFIITTIITIIITTPQYP